ncbi:MAG: glycosyltransferase [Clostridiaceae bacterium]
MHKILILTASTGEGHNQAANSLMEVFKDNGDCVIKFDFLKEGDRILNYLVSDGYEILAKKAPKMYGKLYKKTDTIKINRKIVKKVSIFAEHKLCKFIKKQQPDIIIGTHPFSVAIVSKLKEKGNIDIPFISIVTDFKAHYTYIDQNVDAYITANEYTKDSLVLKNVPKYKVFPYGIPIRNEFYNLPYLKCMEKGIFSILIMSGSMGLKGMEYLIKELKNNKNKLKITVVCGNNKVLYKKLKEEYENIEGNINYKILGFTTEVPELMSEANVIISKPGGLTVSESISRELPMIIPFAIPGQEEENSDFLVSKGVAILLKEKSDLNKMVNKLVKNPNILNLMKNNIKNIKVGNKEKNIIDLANKCISKYEKKYKVS